MGLTWKRDALLHGHDILHEFILHVTLNLQATALGPSTF